MSNSPISSKQKSLHPMKVTCIIDRKERFIDTTFNVVETHCNDIGIQYEIRGFQSSKYSDDRYNITKLPAFHIYTDGLYETTFYTNDDVIEMIDCYFEKMKEKEKKRREAHEAWKNYFQLPKKLFRIVSSNNITETLSLAQLKSNPMHK